MQTFDYVRAADAAQAVNLMSRSPGAKFLAGGTNLVDLMRENIEHPVALIDVKALSCQIECREDGSLMLGSGASNTAVAAHPEVIRRFPLLSQAILSGASAQIRNMATVAGNLLQRTRCDYFYDHASRCNKRERGAGCDAIEGFNRMHAVLGASSSCVATHPSDLCVALVALDAIVHIQSPQGARRIPLAELHRLPGNTPDVETELAADELIVGVEVPPLAFGGSSLYRKVRDRASYAFGLVSVAVAVDLAADGSVGEARIALGGVAHKPWRALAAEQVLRGARVDPGVFRAAAEAELQAAVGLPGNHFKIELAKRLIVDTLSSLTAGPAAGGFSAASTVGELA